jgi:hypothetical protein
MNARQLLLSIVFAILFAHPTFGQESPARQDDPKADKIVASSETIEPLVEPPCSYCIEQNEKGFIDSSDRVLAWIRGAHNGGAFPLKYFITGPRVINDTYGLFFFDQNGGYVSAFEKDYGYRFYGWRKGVMIVKGPDGSLWSALTGRALEGPSKGKQLVRVPSVMMNWGHWLLLHPESTAYNLFDGKKYEPKAVSWDTLNDAMKTVEGVDKRLDAMSMILGVEGATGQAAFSLNGLADREIMTTRIGSDDVVLFWYGPTQSAVAFSPIVDGKSLTFYPDKISPATAPFKDRETGTRWSLAGRGIDGPLRGKELKWVPSVQCRWLAWSAEYPLSAVVEQESASDPKGDQ